MLRKKLKGYCCDGDHEFTLENKVMFITYNTNGKLKHRESFNYKHYILYFVEKYRFMNSVIIIDIYIYIYIYER